MIIAVHQPQYIPWLGYFDKMDKADIFCCLDNVQYKKNEWQNRNRIKTAQGSQWLTVPVKYRYPQKINEVRINNNENWRKKHLQSLKTNYGKAPYFHRYMVFFESILEEEWQRLSELNIRFSEGLIDLLGISLKKSIRASDFTLSEDPTQRLVDICRLNNADTYLSGREGARYMDMDCFADSGIQVVFQDFHHPEYRQLFGSFQSHLSVVDLLFNCGPDSLPIIRGTQHQNG